MVISRSLSFSLAVFSIFVFAEKSYAEESTLQIGIGASVKSKYSGSNRYEYSPIPYFNYESGNGFFINSVYGLGFEYNYPLTEKIEFIAESSLNYEQARRNRDELSGMDKIHATIMNETAFGIDFDHHLIIKMGVNIPLNKLEYGKRYYASVDAPFYYSKTDLLSFSSILYFFDHKYSQTYFGVTQSQSRSSKYPQYSAKSGFGQVDAGIYWQHHYSKNWESVVFSGFSHLYNHAGESPIVDKQTSPMASFIINYDF